MGHFTLHAAAAAFVGTAAVAQTAEDMATRAFLPDAYVLASERVAEPEPPAPGFIRQLLRPHAAQRGTDVEAPVATGSEASRQSPLSFFLRPLEKGDWHFTIRSDRGTDEGNGVPGEIPAPGASSMNVGYTFNF